MKIQCFKHRAGRLGKWGLLFVAIYAKSGAMIHFHRVGFVAAALMLLGVPGVGAADVQLPEITVLSQQFVPQGVPAGTFVAATHGSIVIGLKSTVEWELFALELRLNTNAQSMVIIRNQILLPPDYPVNFSRPHIAVDGDQMTITISGVDALRQESFAIGVRVFGLGAPWVTFNPDFVLSVNHQDALQLPDALAHPPDLPGGRMPLDRWLGVLFHETLAAANPGTLIGISVSYGYAKSLTPVVPVCLMIPRLYDSGLAMEISKCVLDWYKAAAPHSDSAAFVFSLTLFEKGDQPSPRVVLGNVFLILDKIELPAGVQSIIE